MEANQNILHFHSNLAPKSIQILSRIRLTTFRFLSVANLMRSCAFRTSFPGPSLSLLLNLVIDTCANESCFLHNCWSRVRRHSVAHGINRNFLFISAFGHYSVGSVWNLWSPPILTVNRSGVDRDRDVVDVSLRGLEGGGIWDMLWGQRIQCCNLAVLTLYTLRVHWFHEF